MIGKLVLEKCLSSDKISEIISLVRKPTENKHPKLTEVAVPDFTNYTELDTLFKKVGTAFFCVGVYTGQVADEVFKEITVTYAVAFSKALEKNSPNARICLLSGSGADRTEKSKTAFARYKGMAENQIALLNLRFFSFRPAYIYPVEQRKEPNIGYKITRFLYPIIRWMGKKYSIKSTELADAMFNVAISGADKQILENDDIMNYAK